LRNPPQTRSRSRAGDIITQPVTGALEQQISSRFFKFFTLLAIAPVLVVGSLSAAAAAKRPVFSPLASFPEETGSAPAPQSTNKVVGSSAATAPAKRPVFSSPAPYSGQTGSVPAPRITNRVAGSSAAAAPAKQLVFSSPAPYSGQTGSVSAPQSTNKVIGYSAAAAPVKQPVFSSPVPVSGQTSSAPAPQSTNKARLAEPGAQPASSSTTYALDDQHKLAIGDRVSFRIEEDQEESKALTVADAGDLEVPYLGRFPAEGKSCKQLAAELKKALEKDYYYQATVIIAVDLMAKSRGKIYIVGPVRMPGPQDIPSDEVLTLSKAIMRAGGFNDFADKRNVRVTRKTAPGSNEQQTFVVDVGEIFAKGRVEKDLSLQPGDLILIPERLIRF
jgi:polysaccharide biosynthesis/export protein